MFMSGLELDNQSLAVTFGKYQPHVYLIQTTFNVDSLLIDVGHFQCHKKAKTPLQTHHSNYRLRVRTHWFPNDILWEVGTISVRALFSSVGTFRYHLVYILDQNTSFEYEKSYFINKCYFYIFFTWTIYVIDDLIKLFGFFLIDPQGHVLF